ncbi:hypothetical protein MNV49_000478 [Pseudohyphozyma bogoriensis]|nr:hypothetical protein MNV49_000478 [Pseudohyphozyma bogoriensis]
MPMFTRNQRRAPRTTTPARTSRFSRTSRTNRTGGSKLSNMFSRGNGRSRRQNRVAGLRAARTNPRTTRAGRKEAKRELHLMGAKSNHVPVSTRIKHFLHIGGKRSNRRRTTPIL